MSDYLHFPNNLKDIKDHITIYIGLYGKLQELFPIKGNSFQGKSKLIATPCILQ